MTKTLCAIGMVLSLALSAGNGLAAEPADIEKFVKARIEIGEMMTNYFQGGAGYGGGQRPSPEQMNKMLAADYERMAKVVRIAGAREE